MKSFFYKTLYPFITIFGVAIIILYRFDIIYPIINFIISYTKSIIWFLFCYIYPISSLCVIDYLMKNGGLFKPIKLSGFKDHSFDILFSLLNPFLLYLSVYYCINFVINLKFDSNVTTLLFGTAIILWCIFVTGGLLQVFFGIFDEVEENDNVEDVKNNK